MKCRITIPTIGLIADLVFYFFVVYRYYCDKKSRSSTLVSWSLLIGTAAVDQKPRNRGFCPTAKSELVEQMPYFGY